MSNFAAFILTHGRPDNVLTFDTLKRQGYSGPIFLLVDDLDKTRADYIKKFGNRVIVFDKQAIANTTDQGDNFNDLRTTTHVRNASFEVARKLGFKYFIQLDDDYKSFDWRFDDNFTYCHRKMGAKLDEIFAICVEFLDKCKSVSSIALAQGGDFIGGASSGVCFGKGIVGLKRKCMNSFICSTERQFQFVGRLNEDVNTYVTHGVLGKVFFTLNQVGLEQLATQSNSGGMTDAYKKYGTYVKSFYTVMYQPSSVKIKGMGFTNQRLHHSISWKNTVPLILKEELKKAIKCDG